LFTARLLYHIVFESYKPFNGQGGGVTTFAPHCTYRYVARFSVTDQ